MKIWVPDIKRRISEKKAKKNATRTLAKKGRISSDSSKYEWVVEDGYYYPYWVGEVYTRKNRVLFQPKEITFYITCDAVPEVVSIQKEVRVSRGVPKFIEISCQTKYILSNNLEENDFVKVIKGAQKEIIDRQFIFGRPYKEISNTNLVYVPMFRVGVRKKSNQIWQNFFVNSLTGEVKELTKA